MSHPSTLVLHQYRLEELDADERAAVAAHCAGCDRCTARLGAQQTARAAFVAEPVPPELERLAPPANGPFLRLLAGATPLFALAAALLLAVLAPHDTGIRTKGTLPDVELWVGSGDGPRAVRPDETLGEGAVVQVLYDTNGASHAVLVGLDARGLYEVYGELPVHDALAPAPFAITLDDSHGTQRFFVVTSDSPIDARAAVEAASTGTSPLKVRSVSVKKR